MNFDKIAAYIHVCKIICAICNVLWIFLRQSYTHKTIWTKQNEWNEERLALLDKHIFVEIVQ